MSNYLKKLGSILSRRQKIGTLVLGIVLFFAMLLEVIGLGVLLPLISLISDPNKINQNKLVSQIKIFFDDISDKEFIIFFLIGFLFFYLAKTIFLAFLAYKQNKFLTDVAKNISNKLFENYLKQPTFFLLKKTLQS